MPYGINPDNWMEMTEAEKDAMLRQHLAALVAEDQRQADFERECRLATPAEACKEFARNYGADHPENAWILTDYDTWERNPAYSGPPVPHPEDY